MKTFDPMVLVAVFQEMLGPGLWLIAVAAVLGFAAFALLLWRERRLDSRRLVLAEAGGAAGGVLALVLMAIVTHSGFTDAGGPVDWLLILAIFGVGALGAVVFVYAALGWGKILQKT